MDEKENHKHEYVVKVSEATGTYEKRDCPGGMVYFGGALLECRGCKTLLFKPFGLREVEVL